MKFEPHPLSSMFPPISDEDFGKLAADIKFHGLHQPIVRYQSMILDGNNRYRACELVKIAPKFVDFGGDDAQARNYVISANIHRRHLKPEDRREIIATLLKADPTQSNRSVADATKTSHHTVEDVREELEAGGQIAHQEKTVGKNNVVQPKKKKGEKTKTKSTASEKEKIEYQKVVDAITANKAYQLFELHLLDALEELSEFSTFEHAEEYAGETIEKLRRRLRTVAWAVQKDLEG